MLCRRHKRTYAGRQQFWPDVPVQEQTGETRQELSHPSVSINSFDWLPMIPAIIDLYKQEGGCQALIDMKDKLNNTGTFREWRPGIRYLR
jgi:hypothetical protein